MVEYCAPFFAVAVLFAIPGYLAGRAAAKALSKREKKRWENEIRKEAIKQDRSVIEGRVSEQLAPFLPDFFIHRVMQNSWALPQIS